MVENIEGLKGRNPSASGEARREIQGDAIQTKMKKDLPPKGAICVAKQQIGNNDDALKNRSWYQKNHSL